VQSKYNSIANNKSLFVKFITDDMIVFSRPLPNFCNLQQLFEFPNLKKSLTFRSKTPAGLRYSYDSSHNVGKSQCRHISVSIPPFFFFPLHPRWYIFNTKREKYVHSHTTHLVMLQRLHVSTHYSGHYQVAHLKAGTFLNYKTTRILLYNQSAYICVLLYFVCIILENC
jgi:hypothetical protein